MPANIAATDPGYFVKLLPFLRRFPWSDSALHPFLKQFWPSENIGRVRLLKALFIRLEHLASF